MREHKLNVEESDNALRLDVFLTKKLTEAPSRSFIKKLIDSEDALVNGKSVKAHTKVHQGDEITIKVPEAVEEPTLAPENIPLDIFYEDKSLAIINKQIGLVVHPANEKNLSGTLVNALLHHFQELSDLNDHCRPGIVHRLDKETSGLIVISKNNKTHSALANQFEHHHVFKQYIAVVEGEVEFEEGIVDVPIKTHPQYHDRRAVASEEDGDAKPSLTKYRVIKRSKKQTLIKLYPKTGRTHQLRVHMTHLGYPILGDDKYGQKNSFKRLALHAQSLGFKHPKTKKYLEFTSKVPEEFLKLFK